MENKGLEIRVVDEPYNGGVQMVFYERGFNNEIVSIGELIMTEYKEGRLVPPASKISIDKRTVQILIDDLWSCGFRPSEGSGSAGSLKATEKHLEYMRDIAKKSVDLLIEHAKAPVLFQKTIDIPGKT